jgi:ATP-dependent RNA helicase DeaD
MAHTALGGDGDDKEIPTVSAKPQSSREGAGGLKRPLQPARGRVPGRDPRDSRTPGEEMTRLFVGAGRRAGVRPGDLVGAITGEAGIDSRDIGAIEISDAFSLVEVPEARASDIIAALKATKLRGAKVTVRREH